MSDNERLDALELRVGELERAVIAQLEGLKAVSARMDALHAAIQRVEKALATPLPPHRELN